MPDSETLLLLEDGHCLNEHGLTGCGLPRGREAAMVATSLHTLVEMVESGLGSTFVPRLAIDAGLLRGRRIRTVPLGAGAERRIALVWRAESVRGDDFRALASAIAAAMPD